MRVLLCSLNIETVVVSVDIVSTLIWWVLMWSSWRKSRYDYRFVTHKTYGYATKKSLDPFIGKTL